MDRPAISAPIYFCPLIFLPSHFFALSFFCPLIFLPSHFFALLSFGIRARYKTQPTLANDLSLPVSILNCYG
jgi:hypothetical protein